MLHYTQKKTIYKLISMFLFFLLLLPIVPNVKKNKFAETLEETDELVLLWDTPRSALEAEQYLSDHYPALSLLEHEEDYSLCQIFSSAGSSSALLALLQSDPAFLAAEPNYSLESFDFTIPDDPYLDALWSYENPGYYSHYYGNYPIRKESTEGIDMNILTAWEEYPLSKEETRTVVVAVIDTGIDYRHPDLCDQMWRNTGEIPGNGIDDDGNGYIDDVYGWDFYNNDNSVCHYIDTANGYAANPDDNDNHGTHIAGIIAATAGNSIGIAGVASNVNIQLMSLKIHGGSTSSGSVANAIKAIRYAEAMGADICNLSWGTNNYSQALELVIRESSMLFITSAGNHGLNNNSTPVFPASLRLPNLISVAYIDDNGYLDELSNYGVSTVDLAAPGKDIYSTLVGTYGYSSGSSMAAPHVTGLAAMIYAYQEHTYPAQVKELILNTMTPLEQLDGYLINPGIPDAAAAIQSLSWLQPDTEAPFLEFETTYEKNMLAVSVSAYDPGGSGIRKIRYAYGTKTAEFFTSQTDSIAVLEGQILVAKSGYYTFYVEDYAHNYNLYHYYIEDDTTPPEFSVSYDVAPDYSFIQLSLSVSDSESGVKTIKYLAGEYTADSFLSAGEVLDASIQEHSILIDSSVTALTIYLADYRGNISCTTLYPTIVPTTSLHLNVTERTLLQNSTFRLKAIAFPWNTTDGITYESMDESIAIVTGDGVVIGVGEGITTILVTADSGSSAICQVYVKTTTQEE